MYMSKLKNCKEWNTLDITAPTCQLAILRVNCKRQVSKKRNASHHFYFQFDLLLKPGKYEKNEMEDIIKSAINTKMSEVWKESPFENLPVKYMAQLNQNRRGSIFNTRHFGLLLYFSLMGHISIVGSLASNLISSGRVWNIKCDAFSFFNALRGRNGIRKGRYAFARI